LVAGALGLTREDQSGHDALDTGYGVAVRVDAFGTPMNDYHTTQSVAASIVKRRAPRTRAELLACEPRETILSQRAYREDALATIALWHRGGTWRLEDLANAMRQPTFMPYAGRRSNVFGLPLAPVIAEAESLAAAFAQRRVPPAGLESWKTDRRHSGGWGPEVAHDPCVGFPSGLQPMQRVVRRDSSPHRIRWQFADRIVEIGLLPDETGERSR
jgi:CRISPR system Cascade subunit CasD